MLRGTLLQMRLVCVIVFVILVITRAAVAEHREATGIARVRPRAEVHMLFTGQASRFGAYTLLQYNGEATSIFIGPCVTFHFLTGCIATKLQNQSFNDAQVPASALATLSGHFSDVLFDLRLEISQQHNSADMQVQYDYKHFAWAIRLVTQGHGVPMYGLHHGPWTLMGGPVIATGGVQGFSLILSFHPKSKRER